MLLRLLHDMSIVRDLRATRSQPKFVSPRSLRPEELQFNAMGPTGSGIWLPYRLNEVRAKRVALRVPCVP